MKISREEILNCIVNVLKIDKKEIAGLQDDEYLEKIGLDSVQFISLIVQLEEIYGIEFEDEDLIFARINTIKKIQTIMQKY